MVKLEQEACRTCGLSTATSHVFESETAVSEHRAHALTHTDVHKQDQVESTDGGWLLLLLRYWIYDGSFALCGCYGDTNLENISQFQHRLAVHLLLLPYYASTHCLYTEQMSPFWQFSLRLSPASLTIPVWRLERRRRASPVAIFLRKCSGRENKQTKKKSKYCCAAMPQHSRNPATITLEGYWSISHSAAPISPAAAAGRLL